MRPFTSTSQMSLTSEFGCVQPMFTFKKISVISFNYIATSLLPGLPLLLDKGDDDNLSPRPAIKHKSIPVTSKASPQSSSSS